MGRTRNVMLSAAAVAALALTACGSSTDSPSATASATAAATSASPSAAATTETSAPAADAPSAEELGTKLAGTKFGDEELKINPDNDPDGYLAALGATPPEIAKFEPAECNVLVFGPFDELMAAGESRAVGQESSGTVFTVVAYESEAEAAEAHKAFDERIEKCLTATVDGEAASIAKSDAGIDGAETSTLFTGSFSLSGVEQKYTQVNASKGNILVVAVNPSPNGNPEASVATVGEMLTRVQ